MAAAQTQSLKPKYLIWLAMVLGLSVAIVAIFKLSAEPDFGPLPQMAEHPISLPDGREIYVQKYEVTVAEWNVCFEDQGCTLRLRGPNGKAETVTPATGLSYLDVSEYLLWINSRTGHDFRLPAAQEWAHMAIDVLPEKPEPQFTDPALAWASNYLTEATISRALKPQGSFSTSKEGVSDLDGSVWEWTGDCYTVATADEDPKRCPAYVVAGEHLAVLSFLVRDPAQGGCAVGSPPAHLGLRLVSDQAL